MTPSLALLATLLTAEPVLPPEEAAAVAHAQQKAQAEVNKQLGGRAERDLPAAERADLARSRAAADKAVLEKHGVDPKTWVQHNARLGKEGHAAQDARVRELAQKEAAGGQGQGPQEVHVQKGFGEENPVTLDEKQGGAGQVGVERELPPDAQHEMDLARQLSGGPAEAPGAAASPSTESPPAKHSGGPRRGR